MKNIVKISAFLLITILCSTMIINAMDNQRIYLQFSDGQVFAFSKNSIKGIGLIEDQIEQEKGFSQNNPINVPITGHSFAYLLNLASYNMHLNNLEVDFLYTLLKLAKELKYYDLINKLNQALPPAPPK